MRNAPFSKLVTFWVGALALLVSVSNGSAQSLLDKKVTFRYSGTAVGALQELVRQEKVIITYSDNYFADCGPVNIDVKKTRLRQVIKQIIACSPRIEIKASKDNSVNLSPIRDNFRLFGVIKDAENGERIIGATVHVWDKLHGETQYRSDHNGYYSAPSSYGERIVWVTHTGYLTDSMFISPAKNSVTNFILRPKLENLSTVVISGKAIIKAPKAVFSAPEGIQFPKNYFENKIMPGGGGDLMQSVSQLPGIHSGVDGLGGMHVRGGEADQNLVLLDDVPVYNPSHSLGVFSIFNPYLAKEITFWKGDAPARFGGRVSSVLDIRQRDGNDSTFQGRLDAGIFQSALLLEGPLNGRSRQGSYILALRKTYFSPWIQWLSTDNFVFDFTNRLKYGYFDGSLRMQYALNKRYRLFFSAYQGQDQFIDNFTQNNFLSTGLVVDHYGINTGWGNTILSMRLHSLVKGKVNGNTTVRYSRFAYKSSLDRNSEFFDNSGRNDTLKSYAQLYLARVADVSVKSDWIFHFSHQVKLFTGAAFTRHHFKPGVQSLNFNLIAGAENVIDSIAAQLLDNIGLTANEVEFYAETAWRYNNKWEIDAGLFSAMFLTGRQYNYPSLQPRFRLFHSGPWRTRQRLSISRNVQFLHQIGSFNSSFPFELWVPSTSRVPPESAWQFAAGVSWCDSCRIGLDLEVYYKNMDRLLSYTAGNDVLLSGGAEDANGWEDRVIIGEGKSKGLEMMMHGSFFKNKLHLNGSYTWSKSDRQFDDLNLGRPFAYRYDRRHSFNTALDWKICKKWSLKANWIYATGNPITLTASKFVQTTPAEEDPIRREVVVFGDINSYRLPDMHRLDVWLKWDFDLTGKFKQSAVLGAYNAYSRQNPFFLTIISGSGMQGLANQYTLLPILPVFSYQTYW